MAPIRFCNVLTSIVSSSKPVERLCNLAHGFQRKIVAAVNHALLIEIEDCQPHRCRLRAFQQGGEGGEKQNPVVDAQMEPPRAGRRRVQQDGEPERRRIGRRRRLRRQPRPAEICDWLRRN